MRDRLPRAVGPAVLLGLLLGAVPRDAAADGPSGAVVVLDRGSAAKPRALEDAVLAARIARALGPDVPLLLHAAKPEGTPRIGEAKGDTREALEKDARARTRGAFEGPTDVRSALAAADKRRKPGSPGPVVLVGPFGAAGGAVAEKALAAWNENAGTSRVLCVGAAPEALGALAGVRGYVARGSIVLGFGEVVAETTPFSPLTALEGGVDAGAAAKTLLEAVVRIPVERVAVGAGPGDGPLIVARSALDADRPESSVTESPDGLVQEIRVRRSLSDGRVATIAFEALPLRETADEAKPDVLLLAEPPPPRTFTWDRLAPDVSLRGEPFVVLQAAIGKTYATRFRLLRARVGPAPTWTAHREDGAPLETGLTVDVAPEVFLSEEVAESQVTVRLRPTAETPRKAEGRLVLDAGDAPRSLGVPYRFDLMPGRVALHLEGVPEVVALPRASVDRPWRLRVSSENANAPSHVPVVLTVEPASATRRLGLVMDMDGTRKPFVTRAEGEPTLLRLGAEFVAGLEVVSGAPEGLDGATAVFSVGEVAGLEPTAPIRVALRSRHPRLVATAGPEFRVDEGRIQPTRPLTLSIDPDGGDGEWLRSLQALAPRLEAPSDSPVRWALESSAPGTWSVIPTGAWDGPRAEPFGERRSSVLLGVEWPGGPGPGSVRVDLVQAPRWGTLGYVFIALAAIAVALGLFALRQMRVPPLAGTLLYATEGLEGAVGRLDLGAVGAGARAVRSDVEGRLALEDLRAATGRETVAVVRATRVGGMLDVVAEGGGLERRLLVDGLTVTIGRHRIRYVSGSDDARAPFATEEAADLLGPEYDLTPERHAEPAALPGAEALLAEGPRPDAESTAPAPD